MNFTSISKLKTFLFFIGITYSIFSQNNFNDSPKFSHTHGFYNSPFDLTISAGDLNSEVRYTLDGTDPSKSPSVKIGNGSITFGIDPDDTTERDRAPGVIIRAIIFKNGIPNSKTVSQTYLFINKVRSLSAKKPSSLWPEPFSSSHSKQHIYYGLSSDVYNSPNYNSDFEKALLDIPTISIITDLKNLFDPTTGIYMNAMKHGAEWERPASVELLNPDGSEGFTINCGIRVRGGWSRNNWNPKHAFRLFFREEYGEAKLNYPLFENEGTEKFDKIDLRCSQNYSWSFYGDSKNTMIREVFSRDAQREMGQPYTRSRYYHLYINGTYWGLYQTQERSEASYAEQYFGGDRDNYDVVKVNTTIGYKLEATDGNLDAFKRLWNETYNGMESDEKYYRLQGLNIDGTPNLNYEKLLDVNNLIDYMLCTFYAGDFDGPISNFKDNKRPNNFYAIYNRVEPDGFKFFRHDGEHTLGVLPETENRTGNYQAGTQFEYSNPNWLHQKLMNNRNYQKQFKDRIYKHFFNDGVFTPSQVQKLMNRRKDEISLAIIGESARWGAAQTNQPKTKTKDWQPAVEFLIDNYVVSRTENVLNQFINKKWYPNFAPPQFDLTSGIIAAGTKLNITNTEGTIYYTTDGSDPFTTDETNISSSAKVYNEPIILNTSHIIKSRIKSGEEWSALTEAIYYVQDDLTNLKITELNYNPIGIDTIDGDEFEFIEFKNIGSTELNLLGAKITDGIDYSFDSETIIKPGNFIVLAKNQIQFKNRYGIESSGEYSGKLSNGGEKIILIDAQGNVIIEMTYNDKSPWPESADGLGFSIVALNPNPTGSPENYGYWRASTQIEGSPFEDDIAANISPIYVNEILSHTDYPDVDAVELYNPSNESIDISGWYLTDDKKDPKKWIIPNQTSIPENGYIVFNEGYYDDTTFKTDYRYFGSEFSISSHGEDLYIYSADYDGNLTGYVHGFSFGECENGISFGRYITSENKEHLVAQKGITLGNQNIGPRVGSIIISEINYEPDNKNYEYLKITNISNNKIELFHPIETSNTWKIKGTGFEFPQNITIEAGENIYITESDVMAEQFKEINQLSVNTQVFNYPSSLNNKGELLELVQPADSFVDGDSTIVPLVIIDAVKYDQKTPWPEDVSGTGRSLVKIEANKYGNDPINWKSKKLVTGISSYISVVTDKFELSQNYPNPFNPSTTITYVIPTNSQRGVDGNNVSLKVYDLLGREVAVLVNQVQKPGKYSYELNASNLASGIYLYTLKSRNFIDTKKLILLK